MARFYGEVGYGESVENPSNSGVWVDQITEISYFGDVITNMKNNDHGEKVNTDISVANSISILADPHAIENFLNIKYVRWEGVLWTVTSVEVRNPRLILNFGSIYNGPIPDPVP